MEVIETASVSRKLSESDSLSPTYGFMYKSNRPGCEGWELVLLATKFFLAAIPVFATERNLRGVPNSGYDFCLL